MKQKKKSIVSAMHKTAKGLHRIGVVDAITMHEFDSLCLSPAHPLSPQKIRKIRLRENVSQPIFALYLNISPSTVKKWETGEKHPSGGALRLLNIIEYRGLAIINSGQT